MLSENLKKFREKKKMTKIELAAKTGLSFRTIELIEKNEICNPRLYTLQKLAKALGVAVAELIK